MKRAKTFGLVGLGNISSRHIKAIEDNGGKIVATYDVDKSRNPSCKNFGELLQSGADYIVLLTPNKLHHEQAKMCSMAGKKVIVEKPPVINAFDLKYYDFDDDVFVVSQLRYMESIKDLRVKVMRDGGYNVELNVTAHRDPVYLANWRGDMGWSGGLLYTIGIHYFDILTWIFGPLKSIKYVRWIDDWHVQGKIYLERCALTFRIEVSETKEDEKWLRVDDQEIDLATDFFSLHGEVYKDILNGGGISPMEMTNCCELIDELYAHR